MKNTIATLLDQKEGIENNLELLHSIAETSKLFNNNWYLNELERLSIQRKGIQEELVEAIQDVDTYEVI